MSRNDTYLSLCLEQANLSPLHYRHGCIVVRGGKVIGKGYNDYRPGFNGGAQSTGQMSSAGATDNLLITGPKPKKPKSKRCPSSSDNGVNPNPKKSTRNYVAFDSDNHAIGTGGGNLANTPLSMHSEMMAINSALSLSSAIACQGTARSTQCTSKPTPTQFTEVGKSEPPRQSAVASLTFNSLVLKPLQLKASKRYQNDYYDSEEEEEKEEKNVLKRQNPDSNNVHHHAQINYLEFQKANSNKARQLTNDENEKHRNQYLYGIPYHRHSRHKEEQNTSHLQQQQHKSSAVVIPQNRILTKSHHVAERMKDSRLNGADLYVARLGRVGKASHFDCGCQIDNAKATDEATVVEGSQGNPSSDGEPSPQTQPSTGSLHDELLYPSSSKQRAPAAKAKSSGLQATATYSRPCYRCISYMHSAGIKRVFWTNVRGEWEGGKVRELVDALEAPISPDGDGSIGASGTGSVYVTKSEVLLLKGLR